MTAGRSPDGSGSRPSDRAADGVSPVPASIPNAILALARRCETASGPDRELDMDIRQALDLHNRVSLAKFNVTASVDAALTLVPEGYGWSISNYDHVYGGRENREGHIWLGRVAQLGRDTRDVKAATVPLAICAAALRARAA